MNIDLVIAKREYVLEKGITDKQTIESVRLEFRGVNKEGLATFDVYVKDQNIPEGWSLKKYDTNVFTDFQFPKGTQLTPLSVANFINRRTGLGMVAEDIYFLAENKPNTCQVMMSLDSMYFANSFILRTA